VRKNFILFSTCLFIVVLGTVLSKHITGSSYVNLAPNQIENLISNTIKKTQDSSYLPLYGIDFSIGHITHFSNGWLVVPFKFIKTGDTSLVVLHNVNAVDYLILGPGTSFSSSELNILPSSVANYLGK